MSHTASLTKDERVNYVKAIKKLDPDGEVLKINEELTLFRYDEKIKVHENIPIPLGDEELVRGLLVVGLVKIYNYPLENIELELRFELGGSSGESQFSPETDILITDEASKKPYMIFEVKSPYHFKSVMDKTIENQLFKPAVELSQLRDSKFLVYATLQTPLSEDDFPIKIISIDFEKYKKEKKGKTAFDKWVDEKKPIAFTDIPKNYGQPEIKLFIKDGEIDLLKKLDLNDIKNKWQTIWDKIWGGSVEDNNKFKEFNKLILAKIYDEKEKNSGEIYDFQIKYISGKEYTPVQVFNDINRLYLQAFKKYLGKNVNEKEIIGLDNKVLSEDTIFEIVKDLQEISLTQNIYENIDVLAEFYETVIRDAFKQTKGLYLTHPNIVLNLIACLNIEELIEDTLRKGNNNDHRFRLPFIIDPSCGTGTFLIWMMKYITQFILKKKKRLILINEEAKNFINDKIREDAPNNWARDYIYGIEKEAMLATASQINMILHGDGSSNIYNVSAIMPFDKYNNILSTIGSNNLLTYKTKTKSSKVYKKPVLEVFDVIVSNPPFSAPIEGGYDSSNFELSGDSETLFFERWYQLLKPKGRLAVVLPEAFFSVDEYKDNRTFLFKHFNIKAIISLPNSAFSPHTTTLTSLLIAQKKNELEEVEFIKNWEQFESEFIGKYQKINTEVKKLSKSNAGKINIKEKLKEIQNTCEIEFDNKVRFPIFLQDFISNIENLSKVRHSINKSIEDIKEWYILNKISTHSDFSFYSIEVVEIGYKQGKKGSKDRPNNLFTAIDLKEKTKILNIKNSTVKIEINGEDEQTVVGFLRKNITWDI